MKSGKVRYLGASNWRYERIKQANDYAKKSGFAPFIASQIQYSIARLNENSLINDMLGMSYMDEEYQKYASDELSMFSYSSVAKGFFNLPSADLFDKISDSSKNEYMNEYNLALAEKLKRLSEEKGVNISALVLSLLVSEKGLMFSPRWEQESFRT